MRLIDLLETLDLRVEVAGDSLNVEVTGAYASDLISDVLAHAEAGEVWLTLQTHQNIVAVASMKGLAGIVLVGDREPQEDTLRKARDEGVPILVSHMATYELAGRIYALGVGAATLEGAAV